ncbi:MAG: TIGR03936 family radical SAM-associated protein [Anaerolineaceae bacterium]|nr:TIGR03936 family radical SAM-associated protein [Anaerolineaceae bacterium]
MNNQTPIRVRVQFSKVGDLRFTGHIDLQRLFERALRRSGLPIRYSQGFSPKVRLNLASALPLGYSSHAELLDFWLDTEPGLAEVMKTLRDALPKELVVNELWVVPNQAASLQSSLRASEFLVSFPPCMHLQTLQKALHDLLSQETIEIENRGKVKNLRPMILDACWKEDEPILRLCMSAIPGSTGRPDDLVRAMGMNPADCAFERTSMIFEESHA